MKCIEGEWKNCGENEINIRENEINWGEMKWISWNKYLRKWDKSRGNEINIWRKVIFTVVLCSSCSNVSRYFSLEMRTCSATLSLHDSMSAMLTGNGHGEIKVK